MKKGEIKKILLLLELIFASMILLIPFISSAIFSTDSTGKEITSFSVSKEIFFKGGVATCPSKYTSANLYIVESGERENLTDIRGNPQEITLAADKPISNIKIWTNSSLGEYGLIVDCDKDGKYNDAYELFSSFRVVGEKGNASASIGKNDIGDHSWQYVPTAPNLINEILQISLIGNKEDIELNNVTIQALGTGNESDIDSIEIYLDENVNGKIDDNEIIIGDNQPSYTNGKAIVSLDYILVKDTETNILIAYTFKEESREGDYSLKAESLVGTGSESKAIIKFSGLPITSKTTKVTKKICSGNVAIEIEPNPAPKNSEVSIKISGLVDCQNKKILLRRNSCGADGEDVTSCNSGDTGCELKVNVVENRTVYSCIDKNDDNDMNDSGESAFENLIVNPEEIKETITEISPSPGIEKETGETGAGITGKTILGGLPTGVVLFLAILEITLLLIFFALIAISYRLRGRQEEGK